VADTLRRLLRRLGAYPLILIVAWTFPTINRVNNWFNRASNGGRVAFKSHTHTISNFGRPLHTPFPHFLISST